MTTIYRDIINCTRDLMSSVIDNRLNNVMKTLTSITLVMGIPTLVSGIYGMNVSSIPLATTQYGFGLICLLIVIICIVLLAILRHKRFL